MPFFLRPSYCLSFLTLGPWSLAMVHLRTRCPLADTRGEQEKTRTLVAVETARLLISCADRPGIVAAVAGFLAERRANIVALDQHSTGGDEGEFFARVEFEPRGDDLDEAAFGRSFSPVARRFAM